MDYLRRDYFKSYRETDFVSISYGLIDFFGNLKRGCWDSVFFANGLGFGLKKDASPFSTDSLEDLRGQFT